MEFRVLGPIEVVGDGESFAVGGPKQRAVLALLIANAGRPVSTGSLIEGVYGDHSLQGARRSIQTYVSNLRGELGDVIVGTNDGYELAVERDRVDALVFEDAVSGARDRDPIAASALLRDALGLWRGYPYADVDAGDAVDAEIRRLNEMRMQALEARIDADLASGYHRDLIAEIESLTVEYPLRERFTLQQMVALYRSGRQAEALRAYERTRTYLVNEMGLDPSAELRDLERRILEQDASLDLEAASSIRRATVMATDIADPASLSRISTDERTTLIDEQTVAIETAADRHDGEVFANSGTAVYLLFPDASAAASAASDIQRQLIDTESEGHRLRIAIDVGDIESGDAVTGPPVNRSAALVSAGHGGQVLLSSAAQQEITETAGGGWVVRGLGSHDLRGLDSPEIVHQLVIDGLPDRFPDLRTQAVPASLPMAARGLAGYELREEVGAGAFGVVHRAYQPSVGREVAVKVIRPDWANQAEFVRRFEVEAQLVARLEHPHIVPLYDYWREPDSAYLVMRWLRGGTLKDKIASGRLSIDQAHGLLADIGPALAFAHRQGVVHRDLRPSNVLFDDEGGAYITDFGIAGDITSRGTGSIIQDVRALAELLHVSIGDTDERTVTELLARASTEDDSFPDVRSFIAAWEDVVGAGDETSQVVGYTPTRNPYKGLSAFGELDASDFHGRDGLVDQLVAALDENDLVVAVGPSGIGKSSVVKAGLIPALRAGVIDGSDRWLITTMVPGAFPFDELAAALLRVAVKAPSDLEDVLRKDARGLNRAITRYLPPDATLVLVIDQFEELFTLCQDEGLRIGFLDTLVAATQDPHSRIKLVVTIRADFFDRPLAYGDFGALIQEATVPVTSPTETQLDEIVRLPAEALGVTFEAGLPERIVAAVKDQPGALPLLEFSLTELFDARDTDRITVAAYDASGGVKAALGRRAEEIYATLDTADQQICREILLRMVTVSEAGRDTRRRVRLTEIRRLDYDPQGIDRVLDAYATHRLVTFDRDPITRGPTVEVAHEAILTEWARLADWIDAHRDDLLLSRRLTAALTEWETSGNENAYLLSGGRLTQYEALAESGEVSLTSREHDYITTSRTHEAQQRAQRRRRRRIIMSGFAAAAVVAAVLAVVAVIARNDTARQADLAKENQQIAETNRALADESAAAAERNAAVAEESAAAAEEQRTIADAQRLVASAGAAIDSDPDLALLLALEGVSRLGSDAVAATGALREALGASRSIYTYQTPSDVPRTRGDLSPDGTTIAVVGSPGTTLEVVDVATGDLLWDFEVETTRPSDIVLGAKFINDGKELALSVWFRPTSLVDVESVPSDVGVHIFDTSTGELLRRFDVGGCGADREHFERTDSVGLFIGMSPEWVEENGCGFKDAGTVFSMFALDLNTGQRTELVAAADTNVNVPTVALSANGRVGVIASNESVEVVDIETGELLMASDGVFTSAAAVSPDGTKVAFGGSTINDSRQILIHDVATGDRLATIPGHAGSTLGAWFTSDGQRLITSGEDGTVKIWDTTTGLLIDTIRGGQAAKSTVGISADERRLAIFSFSDTVTVASLDPEDAADIGALDACDGRATGDQFYATAGLRVRENRVMVYAGCDGDTFKPAIFDIETREVVDRGPNMVGQNADLSPDATTIAGHEIFRDPDRIGTIVTTNLETGAVVAMEGLCVWVDPDFDGPDCGEPPDESYAAYAWDVDFSPDGRFIAMAPWAGGFGKIWDSGTGESLATLAIDDVEFSPSSDRVVVLSMASREIQLWDTEDFAMIVAQDLPGSDFLLDNLRFTPDGSTIIAAGFAGTDSGDIVFYDASTLEETRRIIAPHETGIRNIAVSDDGTMLATAGADGVVKVWNVASGEILQSIRVAVDDRVQAVAFANDDRYLLATTPQGPVLIFALDSDELIRTARSRLIRGFTQTECDQYFQQENCPTLEEMRSS